MGGERYRRSIFNTVICHRVKVCIVFAGVLGVLGISSVFLKYKKVGDVSRSDIVNNALVLPAIPSFSKLASNMNPNNFIWHNQYNLVHVIETDFLQYQLDLVHMNKARLDLFETFTLPSLKQQSTKEFLWLIWTDPSLAGEFRQQLIKLVGDMPNVVILGFRRNKKIDFRELNGLSEEDIDDVLVTGSKKLLLDYYKASQEHLLIETRLDADDAFNKDFINLIQQDAANTIGKSDLKTDYRIFCPEHHTEWRYYKPKDQDHAEGHLVHYHNPSFCINTGLTIGYQTDAKSRHLQTLEQCNMNTWYLDCKDKGYDGVSSYSIPGTPYLRHYCVMHSSTRHLQERKEESERKEIQDVLMSRTPTAAGMKRVLGTESSYKSTFESISAQNEAWDMIEKDFGVKKEKVFALRRKMESDIENILRDALEGQCMPGHSCKASTKRKLMKLLDKVKENAQRDMQN